MPPPPLFFLPGPKRVKTRAHSTLRTPLGATQQSPPLSSENRRSGPDMYHALQGPPNMPCILVPHSVPGNIGSVSDHC